MNLAIVGVTGAVGEQILHLLEQRQFPVCSFRCFASSRSLGKQTAGHPIKVLAENCFDGIDLAFFCAGASVSREWIPHAQNSGAFVIDSSSAFRMHPEVPLIIPEINAHALRDLRLVASPNCAATILLMPLFPLHQLYRVKRIVVSTYQAASGAGAALMRALQEETRAFLEQRPYEQPLEIPYAFNLFLHHSALHESGYVEEERKIQEETRKILEDDAICVSATCVRVPVLRAHSISANIEFHQPPSLTEARQAISSMRGVCLFEDLTKNRFPTPRDATGLNEVLCGRLRIDPSQPNTLEFWSVGDQLLKGAALNAVQIAECILNKG